MTIYYRPVFSLELQHAFYEKGRCADLVVEPTAECQARLLQYRLLFKGHKGGAAILGELRNAGTEAAPNLQPVQSIPDGLPGTGWITRGYSEIPGKKHQGVDLAMPGGTDVYTTAFGVIESCSYDSIFGHMIIMRNNDSIQTIFGHNSKLLVQQGDTVFAGQKIALSGNTGQSSAPHLHYEIRIHGKPVNPVKYFVYED